MYYFVFVSLRIILFCDDVSMEFHGVDQEEFKGTKRGRLYLTTHRIIFNNKNGSDKMASFSFPFVSISEVCKCSSTVFDLCIA